MLTKEEHQMVLRVLGLAQLQEYKTQLQGQQQALVDLKRQLDANVISQSSYDRSTRGAVQDIALLTGNIKKLEGSTRDYKQNMIAFSYVLNDFFGSTGGFQQKMAAIANNMPMMFAGLGGIGHALGALLPIMGAVGSSAGTMWKEFFGADYEGAKANIEALRKKVRDWEDEPPRLPLDASAFDAAKAKLEGLQDAAAAFERARKTAFETDVAAQANKAVRETIGTEGLAGQIQNARQAAGLSYARPEDEQEMADRVKTRDRLRKEVANPRPGASFEERSGNASMLTLIETRIGELTESIARQNQAAAVDLAGKFASGDVPSIGKVKGLMNRAPDAFDRDFQDAAIVLPGSSAEVKAIKEDIKRRDLEDAKDQREKIAARAIERQEEKNQEIVAQQAGVAERLKERVGRSVERVGRDAGPALKKEALAGLAAGESDAQLQARMMRAASEAVMADDSVRPEDRQAVAFRAGNDALRAERERINQPNEVQLPPARRRPRTVAQKSEAYRARKHKEQVEADARKAARAFRETDRKASLKAGVRPGVAAPPTPEQTAARAELLQVQAKDAVAGANAAAAGPRAVGELQRFMAESQQTIAALTAEINQIWNVFTPAAQAQKALRMQAINQIREQRTRTQSMLQGP